jgi:methylated-DNA-protein-cysteine methyltransferase-like protein
VTPADRIANLVARIPAGSVASYGQVADLAGLPGRARLVGKVLRETPPDRPLPWHRVLRADGRIAFPPNSESGRRQADRLAEEGVEVRGGRVDLARFGWNLDAVLWGPGAV